MMIGEPHHHRNPTILVPPWSHVDDSTVDLSFPYAVGGISVNPDGNDDDCSPLDALKALQHYLPPYDVDFDTDESVRELDFPLDAYSCDQFRMFEFKVRKCTRGRSHDWTDCPFAHPGEKARRRDPRKYHYSGTSCPDYRKGNCAKGDTCEFSHGVFESWLHPARYRTQPCKDGPNCRRRVCFFAHTPDQLRVLSPSPSPSPRTPCSSHSFDGSPLRLAMEGLSARGFDFETAVSPLSESPPPMTNSVSRSPGLSSINEVVASMRQLQLNKVKSMPPSWGLQKGSPGFGSPSISMARPAFCSLPSTPSGVVVTRYGLGPFDAWDKGGCDEPLMERVESGKDLRAKMFEKLCRENPLEDEPGRVEPSGSGVG